MHRSFLFTLVLLTLCLVLPIQAQTPLQSEMLNVLERVNCQDDQLRHAVMMDRFQSMEEFRSSLRQVMGEKLDAQIDVQAKGSGSFTDEIMGFAKRIGELDRDRVKVQLDESGKGPLFQSIQGAIPASYEATYQLCRKFDPRAKTNDHKRLNKEIDAYLRSIENDPCIRYALETTGTKLEQLKANWFGSGLGFEHVIAGELKSSSVSGYHFWYCFYQDERANRARYQQSLAGVNDDAIFTGRFTWDPDGQQGPLPNAKKSKGGFTTGCSAPALIALGHLAIEIAKRRSNCPSAFSFRANINGQTYRWQMYTVGQSIRSLYPMVEKVQNNNWQRREARDVVLDQAMEMAK